MTDKSDFISRTWPNNTGNSALSNLTYSIPKKCPICGVPNAPTYVETRTLPYTGDLIVQVFSWKCTNCYKRYITGHTRKSVNATDKTSDFLFIYPELQPREFSDLINDLSPRFVDIYKEAAFSETHGNFSSAGIAYRLSIEILVKDYAIKELGKSEKEVAEKKLFKAIEDYLPDTDVQSVADVIRLKGNDYTHFKEKYRDVDFSVMKDYFNIFIDLIEVQLKIKHPPIGNRS